MSYGERISIDGFTGTIKFKGNLVSSSSTTTKESENSEWLGIEWDDPSRGKHSGTLKEISYFTTSIKNAGSFVRASSKKINFGRSFLDALIEKYIGADAVLYKEKLSEYISNNEIMDINKDVILKLGNANNIDVETVGWEKISKIQARLDALKEVGLSGEFVSFAGPEGKIKETCPSIVDIDLSRSLFRRWNEIADICIQLPFLKSLRLSFNRLESPSLTDNSLYCAGFEKLRVLVLNHTNTLWNDIRGIGSWCCNLEELHVGFNNLTSLRGSKVNATTIRSDFIYPDEFPNLKILNLESNNLTSWKEIEFLAYIPNLTTLFLTNNKLSTIDDPSKIPILQDQSLSLIPFLKLQTLQLSENLINDWISVHAMNGFGNLQELRFRENPILDGIRPVERHSILTARLANMKRINGTEVVERVRMDDEIYYVFKTGENLSSIIITEMGIYSNRKDMLSKEEFKKEIEAKIDKVLSENPRYEELQIRYGDPTKQKRDDLLGALLGSEVQDIRRIAMASTTGVVGSSQLKNRLIELEFFSVNSQEGKWEELKRVVKTVPVTSSIRNLKNIAIRITSVKEKGPNRFLKLYAHLKENSEVIELDDDTRELHYYKVKFGDEIIVEFA
ncbi:hypothetical protein HK096_002479 [Nowakowskiella sp. JEL0078]|nr:hypothetical protein HK096_002479 [Nowakowskiella sp. JEL0078]